MIGLSALLFILVRMRGEGTQGSTLIVVCHALSSEGGLVLRVMLVNMLMVCSNPGFILLSTGLGFAKMRPVVLVKFVSLLTNLKNYVPFMLPLDQRCLLRGLLQ